MNEPIMKKKTLTYAEFFSGCGGLSLGLEAAGFERVFANELSPMAGSTYEHNLLRKTGRVINVCERKSHPTIVGKWVEDPREYFEDPLSEHFLESLKNMKGDLYIGSIYQVLEGFRKVGAETLDQKVFKLDILAGGPPCQSFSLAGRRDRLNPRNQLPFAYVECAKFLQPKVVVMENVSGIMHAFREEDGDATHAWLDIAKAYYEAGFVPICTHSVVAKYGVPQRRPRFVMYSFRNDIAYKILEAPGKCGVDNLQKLLRCSIDSFKAVSKGVKKMEETEFHCVDINLNAETWPDILLQITKEKTPTTSQAIGDIPREYSKKACAKSKYVSQLHNAFPDYPRNRGSWADHEFRSHGTKVRARFRILRELVGTNGTQVTSNNLQDLTESQLNKLLHSKLIFPDSSPNGFTDRRPRSRRELDKLLHTLLSKKHSQRALVADEIAPAQLTIPDDLVHYDEDRTLTVREMARIQSFPDGFEFCGKMTTGGSMRSYEVPRYTQVGNAVPPLFAKAIGEGIAKVIELIGERG